MGGNNAQNNFSETQELCYQKMLGKKLYSHEYRDQKMGGTKRAKQFFQKHTNSAIKNFGEKIDGKK